MLTSALGSICVRRLCLSGLLLCAMSPLLAAAQTPQGQASDPSTQQGTDKLKTSVAVTVIGTTPLPGIELPASQIPSPVQTATGGDITTSRALDLSDFLNRQFGGVHVNETQGNPFQPDVSYRGYTASPLLGTPQGLSVYMDGVRLNQPFGEVVSWDLIPKIAIASTTLMPGSNPLFGLNTLGGALSVQTKEGRGFQGTTLQATYGSHVRRAAEFEHGGQTPSKRVDWYLAGTVFGEDGWRQDSGSDVRQVFGKVGWRRDRSDLTLSVGHANNELNGNGLQEFRLLGRDYGSVYTKPDTTKNRSTMATVSGERRWASGLSLLANAYYRGLRTSTLNGDINEDSLDQSLYQPGAAERAALAAAGYGSIPASGLDATNTPFPSLRCIGNVLLNDEPAETCNGLINRTGANQRNGGLSGQVIHRRGVGKGVNFFAVGAAFDASSAGFIQSTELGYLNPDRSVTGVNAFGDGGVTGGEVDGQPFDTRVDLDGTATTWSVYATDTVPLSARAHLTVSGRYNRTSIQNLDQIEPGGGPTSLDGNHTFGRFNPAVGITFDLSPAVNVYAGYNEGSRAATSIELGCANQEQPCKLPNAMAGDPPLSQVVTRTGEVGIRGARGPLAWHGGVFQAENHDDILFVTSERTGFGYFRNFGQTRRQGFELGARTRTGRVALGAEYTFLLATFRSGETLSGESNSTNDAAQAGLAGLEGSIGVEPGDQIPLIPRHLLKVFADLQVSRRLSLNVNLVGAGASYARGNENNLHEPSGPHYLSEGTVDGYAVVNLGAQYGLTSRLDLVAQINNLFDRRYATAAQLGPTGLTETGRFLARPLPSVGGEFPLVRSTFLAPGAPLRAWCGVRARF